MNKLNICKIDVYINNLFRSIDGSSGARWNYFFVLFCFEEQRRAQMEEVERGLKRGRMRAKNRANTAAAAVVSGSGSASKKCSVCKRRWTIGSEVTCSDCSKF